MTILETIAIRKANGKRSVIARRDYDPKKHVLWDTPPPVEPVKAKPAPPPLAKRRGR